MSAVFFSAAAHCKPLAIDWAAKLSNEQLVILGKERVASGRLAATCGKHDGLALYRLRNLDRQLLRFDKFPIANNKPKNAGDFPDICIPEGRPDEDIQTVKNVLRELRLRANQAGVD